MVLFTVDVHAYNQSQNAWAVSVRRHDDFKALVHKKADFGFVQGFFWAYPRTFGSPLSHKQHNHRDQNEWPTYDVFVRVFHQRPGWSGTRMTMTRRNLFKAGALFSLKLSLWKQRKTFKLIDSEWQKVIFRETVMSIDPNTVLIGLKINPNTGLYILKWFGRNLSEATSSRFAYVTEKHHGRSCKGI